MNKVIYNKNNTEWLYFIENYAAKFRKKQGTEQILAAISKYSREGSWLDLGCGSNSFFWRIAMPEKIALTGIDISEDALKISEWVYKKKYLNGAYQFAYDHYSKISQTKIYDISYTFFNYDLLNKKIFSNKKFNMITQFGLLGLVKSKSKYLLLLSDYLDSLKDNGVFIGCNWIFTRKKANEYGFSNEYITSDFINNFSKNKNISVISNKRIPILDDPNYSSLQLYVLEKERKLY